MSSRRLTDALLRTYTAAEPLTDTIVRGLQFRYRPPSQRAPNGTRSFTLYFRIKGDTKKRSLGLGRYPEVSLSQARTRAQEALSVAAAGDDPHNVRKEKAVRRDYTVRELVEDYLDRYVTVENRPKTLLEKRKFFQRHLLPEWGSWPVDELPRREMSTLVDRLKAIGPATAISGYRYLAHLFDWALEDEKISQNPLAAKKAPKGPKPRERVLTDGEIAAIWQHLDHPVYGPLVKLLLLTGQRRNNVAAMRWFEVNLESREWRIPAERMKGNRGHVVPLSDLTIEILTALPRFDDGPFVLSTTHGTVPFAGFSKENRKLCERSEVSDWTLHDLRRTAGTLLQRLGFSLDVIGALLAHKLQGVSAVYLRYDYANETRLAVDALQNEVLRIAGTR